MVDDEVKMSSQFGDTVDNLLSEPSVALIQRILEKHPLEDVVNESVFSLRPLENVYRGRRRYGTSTQATDRSAYLVEWMSPDEFTVSGFVDGPADRIDRQDHWLRRVWPYISPGARVNIYQDWSDGRRGRREYDTASAASGGQVLRYGVLYTSQRDGEYGRWLCRRSVDDPAGFTAEWPSRMRRRMPFTLKLHNYEGSQ